jgi:hypothetical protein
VSLPLRRREVARTQIPGAHAPGFTIQPHFGGSETNTSVNRSLSDRSSPHSSWIAAEARAGACAERPGFRTANRSVCKITKMTRIGGIR